MKFLLQGDDWAHYPIKEVLSLVDHLQINFIGCRKQKLPTKQFPFTSKCRQHCRRKTQRFTVKIIKSSFVHIIEARCFRRSRFRIC